MTSTPKRPIRTSLLRPNVSLRETRKSEISGISLAAVIISGFALIGTVFLWMLRNAGHAYRTQYLLAYGFQPDALPWGADDLVYLGYYVQEDLLATMLGLYVGFAVFSSFMFCGINWISNHLATRRVQKKASSTPRKKAMNIVTSEVLFLLGTAVVLAVLLFCSIIPLSLLEPIRTRGQKDALVEMKAIDNWNTTFLTQHHFNFVEITRDKVDPVSGIVISCTDKFCALYSPVGPIHTHTVPLENIKTWSKRAWNDVPANERTGDEGKAHQ
jgi:hypothetical protein